MYVGNEPTNLTDPFGESAQNRIIPSRPLQILAEVLPIYQEVVEDTIAQLEDPCTVSVIELSILRVKIRSNFARPPAGQARVFIPNRFVGRFYQRMQDWVNEEYELFNVPREEEVGNLDPWDPDSPCSGNILVTRFVRFKKITFHTAKREIPDSVIENIWNEVVGGARPPGFRERFSWQLQLQITISTWHYEAINE